MSMNFTFHRFDHQSKVEGFSYKVNDKFHESDYDHSGQSLTRTGYNVNYNIKNYMAEAIMLGGNLRVSPTKIRSLRRDDIRPMGDMNNFVVITIHSTENNQDPDPKKRNSHTHKTEIRIPGKMLNQGSVFIHELDCYIMTESQVDATRELIARDSSHHDWDSINVPSSMINHNPEKIYVEYKQLAQFCIKRQDKISIRVGIDLQYDKIPDSLRKMRIAILDSYFIPYSCYKLVYDPTLGPDEYVIENLYLSSRDQFKSTFSELGASGAIYLDQDEVSTLFGTYYGMAIFANEEHHINYVHSRKSQERFKDETLFVAHRTGDPRLKEEIQKLGHDNLSLKTSLLDRDDTINSLNASNKKLKMDIKDREDTIQRIKQHHDARMSPDVVMSEMVNEELRLRNESKKIDNERIDQDHRERVAPLVHRATMLKNMADIMKSGWGLATAGIGGVVGVTALCRKYNIKLVMGN